MGDRGLLVTTSLSTSRRDITLTASPPKYPAAISVSAASRHVLDSISLPGPSLCMGCHPSGPIQKRSRRITIPKLDRRIRRVLHGCYVLTCELSETIQLDDLSHIPHALSLKSTIYLHLCHDMPDIIRHPGLRSTNHRDGRGPRTLDITHRLFFRNEQSSRDARAPRRLRRDR
jgi:hypothetical protein